MSTEILFGLTAPPGPGTVVEVHLDIMDDSPTFLEELSRCGFANDPFLNFFPTSYHFHYTGRNRVSPPGLRLLLRNLQRIVARVFERGRALNVRLYAECELVRQIHHHEADAGRDLSALAGLACVKASPGATAKADIHVEFRAGTVPSFIHQQMIEAGFYWVSTPITPLFPSEEIATLQTSTYRDASILYDRLVRQPLPFSTGIHLEQKLWMLPSHENLPLPPVMVPTLV